MANEFQVHGPDRERFPRPPPTTPMPEASVDSVASITRPVVGVHEHTTLDALSVFLLEHQVSSAVVLDANHGHVLGFVSMTDLVREHVLEGETREERLGPSTREESAPRGFHLERQQATTVRDIMMPFAAVVSDEASVPEAAARMAVRGVHRLLVVSRTKVVGVVEARDILRWVAERFFVDVADDADQRWRKSCETAL